MIYVVIEVACVYFVYFYLHCDFYGISYGCAGRDEIGQE
jgi:hypothetical protein